MEFHEKLQELRKDRGLTQEELAGDLYVSRTTISKWESGRGYPGIDCLKQISAYFSVSIDELLTGEKLISIAEKENKSNIKNMCDMFWGVVDVLYLLLIVLPLYPNPIDGHIYAVNLAVYKEITAIQLGLYWTLFLALIIVGIVKIILTKLKINKTSKIWTVLSILLGIVLVFLLAISREAYALVVAFLLLIIKSILLLTSISTGAIMQKN